MKKNNLQAMRHSCEHVLTQAIMNLYPGVLMAMGPATEEGFYFDFDKKSKISEADFPIIEKEMKKIIKENLLFKKQKLSLKKARKLFKNNPYKQEWLDEIEKRGEKAVVYWTGKDFVDLCGGPHVKSTAEIGPFKLLSIAGAYWRGDEKNPMLARIYGTCFKTKAELDKYLKFQEEAKKRDHRKLGKELDLFSFHPEAPGDVFWHSKGYIIIKELCKYWREIHNRENYVEIRTPEILTREVWDRSGHTKNYLHKMYKVTTSNSKKWNMAIRPMNCNGGMLIYKNRTRSYKELPLRMGELGVVHRYETSGELHGILRPREFTQDDAHIYCTLNQIKDELKGIINLCFEIYKTCGLKIDHIELSTRPEKSIGSKEAWKKAEIIMREVLKEEKIPHQINEGEGAFYGPKFDFHLKDSIGRTWQCATIQLDFAQPENFDLEYITPEGIKKRPVMIHRTIYGSLERFIGILIEHYAGAFPVWLAPIQAVIIPITNRHFRYGQKIETQLLAQKVRININNRPERLEYKIREAEMQKIPYILVIGDKEIKKKTISVRQRGKKKQVEMKVKAFSAKIKMEIEEQK